jgi:hypothetical protein
MNEFYSLFNLEAALITYTLRSTEDMVVCILRCVTLTAHKLQVCQNKVLRGLSGCKTGVGS